MPTATDECLGQLEHALALCTVADPIQKRIREAVKKKKLTRKAPEALMQDAVQLGIITADERELLGRAEEARAIAIAVDDFSLDTYRTRGHEPTVPMGSDGGPSGAAGASETQSKGPEARAAG